MRRIVCHILQYIGHYGIRQINQRNHITRLRSAARNYARASRFSLILLVSLLPVSPVLHFWAMNPLMVSGMTVAVVSAALVAGTLLLGGLAGLATRRFDASVTAAAVLLFLMMSHGHVLTVIEATGAPPALVRRLLSQAAVHVFYLLVAIGAWAAVRSGRLPLRVPAIAAAVLLVLPLTTFLMRNDSGTSVPPPASRPSTASLAIHDTVDPPHIVVLLLDGYARADVLRDVYDFDNSGFVSALRARGFFVADSAGANYTQTMLSLNSLFNMAPLPVRDGTPLASTADGYRVRTRLADRYRRAAVWRMLGEAGYLRAATAMYGLPAPAHADVVLRHEVMRSMELALLAEGTSWSFLRNALGRIPARRRASAINAFMREQLAYGARMVRQPQPSMLFLHLLAPHPPFTLAARGRRGGDMFPSINDGSHFHREHGTTARNYIPLYRAELPVLNRMVLAAVDSMRATDRPLLLVVMSDHGPGAHFDFESRARSNVRERSASFFAVWSSHGDVSAFPHRITPMNVFPLLFNSHFGTDFPLHPDRAWYSTWSRPLELVDVSEEVWGTVDE